MFRLWVFLSLLNPILQAVSLYLNAFPFVPFFEGTQLGVSMAASTFAMTISYSLRNDFPPRPVLLSIISAVIAMVTFSYYFVLYFDYEPFKSSKVAMMILLSVVFSFCISFSFSVLAVNEYLAHRRQSQNQ